MFKRWGGITCRIKEHFTLKLNFVNVISICIAIHIHFVKVMCLLMNHTVKHEI